MAVFETFVRWIGGFASTTQSVAEVRSNQHTSESLLLSCEYELGQMRRSVQTVLLETRPGKNPALSAPHVPFRLDEKLRSPTRRVA